MSTPASLLQRLRGREQSATLRSLPQHIPPVDFFSNDYLGFSSTGILKEATISFDNQGAQGKVGATGSRLLSGNSSATEALEAEIAKFHGGEAALIFNSGYDANLGLLASLPTRHDTILYDSFAHASIIDGIRLSWAKRKWSFQHNDLSDLRQKLSRATGDCYVVVESVYSMDGDFAPLDELCALCSEYGAKLIVDEAHATGIFGHQGRGRISELALESSVFARVHTFGKALGTHGAAVVGSRDLQSFLVNFARSFIYTTALPEHTLASIRAAYTLLQAESVSPVNLFLLIHEFKQASKKLLPGLCLASESPIQGVSIPIEKIHRVADQTAAKGFAVKPIVHPTVPAGKERIRICLHTFNAPPEIHGVLSAIAEAL